MYLSPIAKGWLDLGQRHTSLLVDANCQIPVASIVDARHADVVEIGKTIEAGKVVEVVVYCNPGGASAGNCRLAQGSG